MGLRNKSVASPDPRWDCSDHSHVIRTDRLVLRHLTWPDRADWFSSIDDVAMQRQGYVQTELLDHFRGSLSGLGMFGTYYETWAVVRADDGTFLGVQSVQQSDRDTLETGGWLAASARGHGYGTEVAQIVAAFVHEHLGYARVIAATEESNDAAIHQYRAAGFVEFWAGKRVLPNSRTADALALEHTGTTFKVPCPHHTRISRFLKKSKYKFPTATGHTWIDPSLPERCRHCRSVES
jgi:RimJ/RimL family protein N-acetyltransferase